MKPVTVASCQLPEVSGDVEQALRWMETYLDLADLQQVDLLCFPECYLQGYLVDPHQARRHAFVLGSAAFESVLRRLSRFRCMFVIGLIELDGDRLFNSAVVIQRGKRIGAYRKTHLLAGEEIFSAGVDFPLFETAGLRFGINICYDTNFPEAAESLARQGAKLILCPANNMMRRKAAKEWKTRHNEIRAQRAREQQVWLVSSDVTGERDGRISYGPTAVIEPGGKVVAQVPLLETGMITAAIVLQETSIGSLQSAAVR